MRALLAAAALIAACSKKVSPAAVASRSAVLQAETLKYAVPVGDTVRLERQVITLRYDTLKGVVHIQEIRKVPVVAETVRTFVPVVSPIQAYYPQMEARRPERRTPWKWIAAAIAGWVVAAAVAVIRLLRYHERAQKKYS